MKLEGKRFGKLTAIKYDTARKKWECRCDCGNICYVAQNNLCRKVNGTSSCGCLISLKAANAANIVERTNVGNIRSKKNYLNNSTTGIKGVCRMKSGRYRAYICFQKKRYFLCESADLNKCIAMRRAAEAQLFGNFLEWLDEQKKAKKSKK